MSDITDPGGASLEEMCQSLLLELSLIQPQQPFNAEPLTGGVSSDIALVTIKDNNNATRKLCIKFARPKLKVEADWFAPVHRNTAEYEWLQVAAEVAPACAIKLHGHSKQLHGFAMEYLEGDDTYLWKTRLLNGQITHHEAAAVGSILGKIHAASTTTGFDQSSFCNSEDFYALRIEPYLTYTATQHTDIAVPLTTMADKLHKSRQVLTHGDVSPKNILFRSAGPVLLDAECATIGDACFDIAFCLNHLILKAIHLPDSQAELLNEVLEFWQAYQPHITWESAAALQSRSCQLIPMLMLARVDGKSPVEYLSSQQQTIVRNIARQLIQQPVTQLIALINQVEQLTAE